MRYAEEQQDLALLSISTFQRALKVSKYQINNACWKLLLQKFFSPPLAKNIYQPV